MIIESKCVNVTGTPCEGPSPSSCSPGQQWGTGCHPATVSVKWNKEVRIVLMKPFHRIKLFDEEGKPIRGYRKRMIKEWTERGMFQSTE